MLLVFVIDPEKKRGVHDRKKKLVALKYSIFVNIVQKVLIMLAKFFSKQITTHCCRISVFSLSLFVTAKFCTRTRISSLVVIFILNMNEKQLILNYFVKVCFYKQYGKSYRRLFFMNSSGNS